MILDTNAISAIADGDAGAVARFAEAESVAMAVIAVGEYRFGIAQSRRRAEYERWLASAIVRCGVLDVTETTTAHYASIRAELKLAGKPIPSNDLWIAALCREHRYPLLSRDEHFDWVRGLRRIGW